MTEITTNLNLLNAGRFETITVSGCDMPVPSSDPSGIDFRTINLSWRPKDGADVISIKADLEAESYGPFPYNGPAKFFIKVNRPNLIAFGLAAGDKFDPSSERQVSALGKQVESALLCVNLCYVGEGNKSEYIHFTPEVEVRG